MTGQSKFEKSNLEPIYGLENHTHCRQCGRGLRILSKTIRCCYKCELKVQLHDYDNDL